MPVRLRIVTPPMHLGAPLAPAHVALLVAADALVRRATAEGAQVRWEPIVLTGDLQAQLATERELLRHGVDLSSLDVVALAEHVRAHEAAARADASRLLAALRVAADLDASCRDAAALARAARTAFVRLYDAGLLEDVERVVDVCPRCGAVADATDAEAGSVPGACLRLRLSMSDGDSAIEVETLAPELLPGGVAVAVPEGHPDVGRIAVLPLSSLAVPVVADGDREEPRIVVPAHDAADLELARRNGLVPVEVLGVDGVVRQPPFEGLARYAAREAAVAALHAEGAVVASREVDDEILRCGRCSTVLLSRLDRHWFLAAGELAAAAADAVREGHIAFTPAPAREAFLDATAASGEWCVSRRLWSGVALPVSTCLDCRRVAVAVDPGTSCGTCMGALVHDGAVIDPRFVGALAPLAGAGWPDDDAGAAAIAAATVLVVTGAGIARWAVPMAALGLRLAGTVPFAAVAVQPAPEPEAPVAWDALVTGAGAAAVRAAVLAGDLDVEAASVVADLLAHPAVGDDDVDALAEAYDAHMSAGAPEAALRAVATAARTGVRPGAADRLRAMAVPLLGE